MRLEHQLRYATAIDYQANFLLAVLDHLPVNTGLVTYTVLA